MTGQPGKIVEFNVNDGLGWIELDEGGRVRFGGTSLGEFTGNPGPGTRVFVHGTAPGYKGVVKAVKVVPAEAPPPVAPRPVVERGAEVAWPDFVRAHPRWSDAEEASLPFPGDVEPLRLTAHPLWSNWGAEIARSPVVVPLSVPTYLDQKPTDPTPAESFAHGMVAFLDQPTWPTCGRCAAPLEFCIQLAAPLLAQWGLGERGLVALICFECAYAHGDDQRIGHVAFTSARERVETAVPSKAAAYMPMAQLVAALPPRRSPPESTWHLHRRAVRPELGAPALFGALSQTIAGPFPPDLAAEDADAMTGDMADEVFDDWIDANPPAVPVAPRGGVLGGVPNWDQRDRTPHCTKGTAHGEMRQLLEYDGGQFLDGGLHVFLCRHPSCDHLAFVAEF